MKVVFSVSENPHEHFGNMWYLIDCSCHFLRNDLAPLPIMTSK